MLTTLQLLMFIMFVLTFVLVLLAEFGTDIRFKRVMAMASIVTVSAAITALVRDPPKAGDWPTLAWELQGQTAKKKQTRTAYVRTGDDGGPDDVDYVVEDKKTRFAEEDSASERVERMFVMAFKTPRDLGPGAGAKFRDCEACPELILVPGGTSRIGADAGDDLATRAEFPQKEVRIWPGYMLGRAEVTAAEYQAFAVATGRAVRSCATPADEIASAAAVCVSHGDALAYVAWLRRVTGKAYRLPSAAEWEYAARAERAGEPGLAQGRPNVPEVRRVGYAAAAADHPWGFSGLGGGVAEITADCWADDLVRMPSNGEAFTTDATCSRNVLKDGAALESPHWRRVSARRPLEQTFATPRIGFRVARSLR